jgi:hypothetical protein
MVVVGVCLLHSAQCTAADKHDRVIGLYDVIVHFQDPNIDWKQISDAFVKQFLVDTDSNVCIRPSLLPARFLGNTQQQTHVGIEGTAGLDYVAFGDLYKDPDGYRMEAYLVTGRHRLIVLQHVQPKFTDPKDAVWQAQMAALNLRFGGSGTRPLADLILDYEKKQREEYPHDHAIAPELKVNLAESDRYPLKLKPGEKRDISFTLMDCDGVANEGAEVQVETITGDVTPPPVKVGGAGKGTFTYTAPRKNADGQIRVAFIYLRGSEHPGVPEVDQIDVHVAADRLSFRTVVDAKLDEAKLQHSETHHSESVYTPASTSGTGCTTAMQPGDKCQLVISSLNATASSTSPNGSHTASDNQAGDAIGAEIVRLAKGATLTLAGPTFASTSPDEDDEQYIGICSAQPWLPEPMQFTLSEDEFMHFSTIQKTLSINSPLGVNNCTGSGTLVLTGQR